MKNIIYPDYQHSTLNTIASIMNHYQVKTPHPSLAELQPMLEKNYKNIVLVILDGMGEVMLNQTLKPSDFLNRNQLTTVTSVFPSTTTAAMTSYYSGLSPIEHGWLGWSLYFKEYGRCIDTFLNTDSYTSEYLGDDHIAHGCMGYKHVLDRIEEESAHDVKSYMIQPSNLPYRGNNECFGIESFEDACQTIKELTKKEEEKFIFVYWNDPDKTMHGTGCYSSESRSKLQKISQELETLSKNVTDTLFIISADHGLLDMKETIALNEIAEIDECLSMPPFIEKRAISFFVKPQCKDIFVKRFNERFSDQFILLTREEVFEKQLFGFGTVHKKSDDFIGDYLACATGDIMLDYATKNSRGVLRIPAMHAGLTKEEMLVPVIVAECK